jgi:hypothetical protein
MKSIFRRKVWLATAVPGLAMVAALAFGGAQALAAAPGPAPVLAAAGPASTHDVHPMADYGNIVNLAASTSSNMCLGTHSGHNDTYTVIWPCNGSRNQSWTAGPGITYDGGEYVMIKNENGDCLGLQGGHVGQGTPVVAWTCNPEAKNQYWFHMFQLGKGNPGQDMWVLCNLLQPCAGLGSGRVAGVSAGSVAEGARVVLWDNNGDLNQIWYCSTGITC